METEMEMKTQMVGDGKGDERSLVLLLVMLESNRLKEAEG